jgi:hypothetical protein
VRQLGAAAFDVGEAIGPTLPTADGKAFFSNLRKR